MSLTRKPGDLITKDPLSDEPQGFDWTAYLAELGSTAVLTSSVWTITGPDAVLTQHDASILAGSLQTQAYFAAGTVGSRYTVTNKITVNTSPVTTDERSFFYLVQAR